MTTAGKWMPAEPTEEMLEAGEETFVSGYTGTPTSTPANVYRAMYAVAPASPGAALAERIEAAARAISPYGWDDAFWQTPNRQSQFPRNQQHVKANARRAARDALLAAFPEGPPGSEAPVPADVRKVLEPFAKHPQFSYLGSDDWADTTIVPVQFGHLRAARALLARWK